jgi:intein/homing endonuclease
MADDPKVEETVTTTVEEKVKPTGEADQGKPPEAGQKGEKGEDRFSKAEVENIVQQRLAAEKEASRKREEKARKEAETEEAKKNGEYKKLAESQETELKAANTRLAELEPFEELAKRYEKSLNKHLEVIKKGLPEHILKLLARLKPDEQLDYIAENAEALKPATVQEKPKGPSGNGHQPPSAPGEKTQNVILPPHMRVRL